ERHGLVLVRMTLSHAAMSAYPSTGDVFPASNAATRAWLQANPPQQNLFALGLDTGAPAFLPAVGYGTTEDYLNGAAYGVLGSQRVVKVWPTGPELASVPSRSGQSAPPACRWASQMGEMVLDAATVPGLAPGDLRFVRMSRLNGQGNAYVYLTDEQEPLTLAGSTLFHAHWGASESVLITDRSAAKGLAYASPIATTNHPPVVRRVQACADNTPPPPRTTCGRTL